MSAAPNDSAAAATEATGANAPIDSGIRAKTQVATAPSATPTSEPEADLLDDEDDEVVDAVGVGPLDPRDEPERERDRHRVVAARLGLERAREPAADVREAKRREDGRRVGRRDDRAEQERLEPGEVEAARAPRRR